DFPGPARAPAERLRQGEARDDRDERAGRLRGGRRPGPRLPPGGHGGGDRLHGRARGRAVPGSHPAALELTEGYPAGIYFGQEQAWPRHRVADDELDGEGPVGIPWDEV